MEYYATTNWADVAIRHNSDSLGQEVNVVTSDSAGWRRMYAAAKGCGNHDWRFGTLTNYIAMREFLETSGPDDDLFVWLEADMVINPLLTDHDWLNARGVFAIWQKEHLLTPHERYKRQYAVDQLGIAPEQWTQILSTMVLLERRELRILIDAFHRGGYDLYDPQAWQRIASNYAAYPDHSFYCDQVLEFAYILADIAPRTIKDLVGWVSYDSDYSVKHIVHFDNINKPALPGWLADMRRKISQH